VEQAHKDVKQGVVHLEKTKELEKSTRAKSVIMCLLTTIFILTILMVIKHT
jgi:t-SNARE complex subunit (syntaxin)